LQRKSNQPRGLAVLDDGRVAVADFGTIESPQLDMLMALEVVDHVEHYLGFLRMLKSRATLKLFSFSLDISVQSAFRAGAFLQRRNVHNHLHHFSKETALSALEYTGFKVLDWEFIPFLPGSTSAFFLFPSSFFVLPSPSSLCSWLFFVVPLFFFVRFVSSWPPSLESA